MNTETLSQKNANPLLSPSGLFLNTIPFDRVRPEHFLPALNSAIAEAHQALDKIKSNPKPATFENTFVALETASQNVGWVSGIFFYLFNADGTPEIQKLAGEMSQILSRFQNDVSLDEKIFARVRAVYQNKSLWPNDNEGQMLVEETYTDFVRNGAELSEDKKNQLRKLDEELASLGPKFSDNVLQATNKFELWLSDEKDLAGLPPSALEAAKAAAKAKGKNGYLFTLHGPSFIAFLTYADNRELREKMWRAQNTRAFKDDFDNTEAVYKIADLRHKRAQLLGYATHADFALQKRMANSKEIVWKFLRELAAKSRPAAFRDVQEVANFKKSLSGDENLMPWDYAYYSEKLQSKEYAFDSEMWRPYLELNSVLSGLLKMVEGLFGVQFIARKDIPVYHADVSAFEVRDLKTQSVLGIFYTDFFPRETKKGGAWCSTPRSRGVSSTGIDLPIVAIVCNFTKPTATEPSLLTLDEVKTLFHEFGHALHNLLTECKYSSLSGTNVYWDFVELPSQLLENWVLENETLAQIAKHYKTGDQVPKDLVEKTQRAEKFQAGYMSLRQLSFGFLDMTWYAQDISKITDIESFEFEAMREASVLPDIPGTNKSVSFGHIFGGGYAAGYYSYKWAEVLDADAFEYFKQNGIFNADIGMKYRRTILAKGGSVHPKDLYREFRGQEPSMEPLLLRSGLI